MSKGKKPRICEILDVEVNQEWIVDTPAFNDLVNRINASGDRELRESEGSDWYIAGWELMLMEAINHPETVKRLPRWTAEEQARAKAIKTLFPWAKYAQMESSAPCIQVYDDEDRAISLYDEDEQLFPHLADGEAVTLDEIIGGEADA